MGPQCGLGLTEAMCTWVEADQERTVLAGAKQMSVPQEAQWGSKRFMNKWQLPAS